MQRLKSCSSGHSKPVDIWSLGVITYTLLCGYSPFRSESLPDLIEETKHGRVIFHDRYWKDVSQEAKAFILTLLQPDPAKRATSSQALKDPWIAGQGATDHDLLPEIKAYISKARLKRGIELVKLANRIESLKMQEDEEDDVPQEADIPADSKQAAGEAVDAHASGLEPAESDPKKEKTWGKLNKGAIFREVSLHSYHTTVNSNFANFLLGRAREGARDEGRGGTEACP
jgi:calcium/calmodulin-dependent protein kinase I